jgi:hypothetical protein
MIKISSFEDLRKIGTADDFPLDGSYELTADIDASSSRVLVFLPIGTSINPFTGTFDGREHNISGLYINRPTLDGVGLFGYARNAEIKGVRLDIEHMVGKLNVGALVGLAEYTEITGCSSTGYVNGFASIGGLVGSAFATIINECFSSCECLSTGYRSVSCSWSSIGGLVGHAEGYSAIACSYASGDVIGTGNNVGGLLGFAGGVDISKCYSTGNAKGRYDVGGFVGNIAGTMGQNFISNCYSTGNVKGSDNLSVGGFVGNVDRDSKISKCYSTGYVRGGGGFSPPIFYDSMDDCFWDGETSNQPQTVVSGNAVGKKTAEMMQKSVFANWNFNTVWTIDEGSGYPKLYGVVPFIMS